MAVPKWNRSKSKQGQRRMHLHLTAASLLVCQNCKKQILGHRACPFCGFYRGKEVVDVLSKAAKKETKKKASQR
ncbi:MAG: 50S ribosomal protein L32 [bacterium]|nr:50S ribosomal protein L32 [bacterium]